MLDRPDRFLALLRDTHPDFEWLFLHGGCYHLFLILRELWPEAELWYVHNPGHVYVRISGAFYDIRGRHARKPRGAVPMTVKRLNRPDRWKRRLALLIDGVAAAKLVLKDEARREK